MRLSLLLSAAALLGAVPAAAAVPPPAPIEALAQIPFVSDPILSPDGKRIATRVNVDGKEQLAVYDLAAPRTTPPTLVPKFSAIRWFRWAGNNRLLISTSAIFLFGALPLPVTRLFSVEIGSSKPVVLGKNDGLFSDGLVFADPDGRYILLAEQSGWDDSKSVNRIDLATGAVSEVQRKTKGIWSWFADSGGAVRGGISYGEDGSWTVYRRDPATGDVSKIGKLKQSPNDSNVDSILLLPGSDKGLIVTNAPNGRFGIYDYDFATATVGAPVFEHPKVDVTDAILSPGGDRVEGVVYEDDLPHTEWLDPAMKAAQANIDRALPGKVNRIVDRSHDGNVMLILSASASDPGIFYVYDRGARRIDAFAAPFEKLVDQPLASVKPVHYAARDGLDIPAYLTLPPGREAKDLPLILMPHGGPFARDDFAFAPWVQMLATRGYVVLQPNFRGSTGFGRDFAERGYGAWGAAMQDDLDDGVAWLVRQHIVDPKRICIMGGSYGGYAALWGAIRNPELYRCAISLAGVTDIRAILAYDGRSLLSSRYSKQWRKRVEGEQKRDLAAISPLQQADRLHVPVLIAHGEEDSRVPVEQGKKMVAALKARGAPVQAVFYPNEGHGFEKSEDSIDFMRRVEAFLAVHNPSDTPAAKGPREAEYVAGDIVADDYPPLAAHKHLQGKAELRFQVTADGRVEHCTVATSSGFEMLDQEACRLAEERFQYRPARGADGRPIAASATRSVSWKLPAPTAKGAG